MIVRWITGLIDYIHKGYNTFTYRGSPSSDTTPPTIMYGFLGR